MLHLLYTATFVLRKTSKTLTPVSWTRRSLWNQSESNSRRSPFRTVNLSFPHSSHHIHCVSCGQCIVPLTLHFIPASLSVFGSGSDNFLKAVRIVFASCWISRKSFLARTWSMCNAPAHLSGWHIEWAAIDQARVETMLMSNWINSSASVWFCCFLPSSLVTLSKPSLSRTYGSIHWLNTCSSTSAYSLAAHPAANAMLFSRNFVYSRTLRWSSLRGLSAKYILGAMARAVRLAVLTKKLLTHYYNKAIHRVVWLSKNNCAKNYKQGDHTFLSGPEGASTTRACWNLKAQCAAVRHVGNSSQLCVG